MLRRWHAKRHWLEPGHTWRVGKEPYVAQQQNGKKTACLGGRLDLRRVSSRLEFWFLLKRIADQIGRQTPTSFS
jgi:hypothetical protein